MFSRFQSMSHYLDLLDRSSPKVGSLPRHGIFKIDLGYRSLSLHLPRLAHRLPQKCKNVLETQVFIKPNLMKALVYSISKKTFAKPVPEPFKKPHIKMFLYLTWLRGNLPCCPVAFHTAMGIGLRKLETRVNSEPLPIFNSLLAGIGNQTCCGANGRLAPSNFERPQ